MSTIKLATVTIGRTDYTIERPSARKSSRALAMIREMSCEGAKLQTGLAEFVAKYEAENVIVLDRVQAKMVAPRDLLIREGEPVIRDGETVVIPSPLDLLTDDDWKAAGNVWRRPKSPTEMEVIFAMFDLALEVMEHRVYRLVALLTLTNQEVKDGWRANLDKVIDERVDALLDEAYAEEFADLALSVAETILEYILTVVSSRNLGGRVGKLRRAWAQRTSPTPSHDAESSDGPQSTTPTSSTDSPASTDGDPTTPSTSPSMSSEPSANDSTPTPPPSEPATTTE